jgi:circadian clock protein KaiC
MTSGIARLDWLLGGGLPRGAINLIVGSPGSGKTMLALQYLFANATPERPGLYLATVSEPFEKVVRYGQSLTFFDPQSVGRSVFFEDLAPGVKEGGLSTVLDEINRLVRTRRPGVVVIDSFRPLGAYADERAFRTFLADLAGGLSVLDASTFWVGEYDASEGTQAPEFAVADAVIALESTHHRERTTRELRVLKLRGSGFASGSHSYRVNKDGLQVFPRLADVADLEPYPFPSERVPSGVPALDAMLGEGYIPGASTLCIGPTGCGKTLVGLHLIFRGSQAGETGLIASLQENPSQLGRVAASFGWTLADERVEVLYRSPVDLYIDEWVYDLLETVERTGARRVMIDSVGDIAFAAGDDKRFREHLYSLIQRLSRRGVSLFMTLELPELFTVGRLSAGGLASLCDNVVLLQYTNDAMRIRRTLTVLKTRASDHDTRVRGFRIDRRGIVLSDDDGERSGA